MRRLDRCFSVMFPTNDPGQGRWVSYRLRTLYPGPAFRCQGDELAEREALQQQGYRMQRSELKRRIRRGLGFRALGRAGF